ARIMCGRSVTARSRLDLRRVRPAYVDKSEEAHVAEVRAHVDAAPDEVFAVLANGWLYSNWVVGTSHMRAVAANWPEVGSRLHHCSGVWPVATRDETVVEESEPDRRLVLVAKGGVLGTARVVL